MGSVASTLHRARLPILGGCMLASGIAGLVYQVVWSRYLALFLGGSGRAQTIILATFMGGLALGAFLLGRRADRTTNPLRLYALLEIGIGFLGLLYPLFFEPSRQLFLAIVRTLGLSPLTLSVAAAVTCALTILVPTTLMGGTLPVLGRYLIAQSRHVGQRIAVLYYLNSLGAVLGSVLAGFFLTRYFGLHGTMFFAALLNLLVAMCCFVLLAFGGDLSPAAESTTPSGPPAPAARTRGPLTAARIALVVIGISGGVSFLYEIAWIRMLTLVLGSSSNSFALMLAAFIFGITLGSYILSLKSNDGGYFRILGWCLVGIGLTALLSVMGYEHLPVLLNQLQNSFARDANAYGLYQFSTFLLCFAVMVVPTIFMGATVPAASRVVADEVASLGRKVGGVFAINTCGSLLGALLGGFLLLPLLGIKHLIETAVALNLLLGLWVLRANAEPPRWPIFGWKVAATLALLIPTLYAIKAPEWSIRVFTAATYRVRERIEDLDELKQIVSVREIIYYKDGKDASIAVSHDPTPKGLRPRSTVLLINGKADASTNIDMYTQMMVAHLPMMLHPDPRTVLVVGFGSGVSIGAVSLYKPHVAQCVELIPEVLEAGEHFKEYNHDVLHNPGVDIIHQDAKTHLQVSPIDYDVIINEPTNPWISGVAGLFSIEYLQAASERLRPDGFFVQWVQTYEIDDMTLFSILNTYQQVFPYSTIFNISATDTVIVGSRQPFDPDFNRMEAVLNTPRISADLAQFGIKGLEPVLSMQMVAKNRTPGPYVEMGGINSDIYPVLEHNAQVAFFVGKGAKRATAIDHRRLSPEVGGLWINQYKASRTPPEDLFQSYLTVVDKNPGIDRRAAAAWCDYWASFHPDSPAMLEERARHYAGDRSEWQIQQLEDPRIADRDGSISNRMKLRYGQYLARRSWAHLPESDELRGLCQQVVARSLPQASLAYRIMGELQRDAARPTEAITLYHKSLDALQGTDDDAIESRRRLHLRLASAHADLREFNKAREHLKLSAPRPNSLNELDLSAHLIECRIRQLEELR